MTLEREIYSIETANINKETLDAMKNAGAAMKQIHAGLTVDTVDDVMYVLILTPNFPPIPQNHLLTIDHREGLREQHAIGEEISTAITSGIGTEGIDEIELEDEFAELQQEALDEQMLNTGNIPMNDKVGQLPNTPRTEVKGKSRLVEEEDDEEAELRKLQAEMAM